MTDKYYYRDPPDRPLYAEEILAIAFWMAQAKRRHGGAFWGLPPTVRTSLIKHAQTALFFAEEMGARVILQQMSAKEVKKASKKIVNELYPKRKIRPYMTKRRRELLEATGELPASRSDYQTYKLVDKK